MKRKRITPQEKKLLSYTKDTRNTYGESSRSRVSIAKNKIHGHQSIRHGQKLILQRTLKAANEEIESIEAALRSVKPRKWRKVADSPLEVIISEKVRFKEEMSIKENPKRRHILEKAKIKWKPKSRYSRWGW